MPCAGENNTNRKSGIEQLSFPLTRATMSEIFGFDAFSPKEIAARVETVGMAKARLPLIPMLMLSVLAGAFIGLGALYFVIVRSDPTPGVCRKTGSWRRNLLAGPDPRHRCRRGVVHRQQPAGHGLGRGQNLHR